MLGRAWPYPPFLPSIRVRLWRTDASSRLGSDWDEHQIDSITRQHSNTSDRGNDNCGFKGKKISRDRSTTFYFFYCHTTKLYLLLTFGQIVDIKLDDEERQYLGDRFVRNKVYPNKIIMEYKYQTDGPLRDKKRKTRCARVFKTSLVTSESINHKS